MGQALGWRSEISMIRLFHAQQTLGAASGLFVGLVWEEVVRSVSLALIHADRINSGLSCYFTTDSMHLVGRLACMANAALDRFLSDSLRAAPAEPSPLPALVCRGFIAGSPIAA
jgi:hypothetical protein